MIWFRKRRSSAYEAMRRRMIRETELGILFGLRFPERVPHIPRVEVGKGSFPAYLAMHFWSETLGVDVAALERYAESAVAASTSSR